MKSKLPEGWEEKDLGNIASFRNGKKASNIREVNKGKYPLYGGNGQYGSVDEFNSENSLVIGRVGAYCGSVHKVKDKFWISDNAIETKPTSKKILSHDFLYYKLNSLNLNRLHQGTSQPLLNQSILKNINILLPELPEQKAIANMLSALDDKIELNNKTNENLEQQAQAIFKHWFVDFEYPNEEGRPYKSSGGEMIDSELGLIPNNWDVVELKNKLNFNRGVEPGSKNYQIKETATNLPFYRVGEMLDTTNIYVEKELLKDRIAKEEDVLVSFDGTVGRVTTGISGGHSSAIRNIYSKAGYYPNSFIYFLFKSKHIQDTIETYATGTTILHASKSIDYMKLPYNKEIAKKFFKISDSIFKKILLIKRENKALSELRDTLLPKLMSGEIRIPLD